jgi:hypothetical protein
MPEAFYYTEDGVIELSTEKKLITKVFLCLALFISVLRVKKLRLTD